MIIFNFLHGHLFLWWECCGVGMPVRHLMPRAMGSFRKRRWKPPAIMVARFCRALFDGGSATVALDVHLDDGRVMDEAIDRREGHGLTGKDLAPFAEQLVGGDQQRAPLVAGAARTSTAAGALNFPAPFWTTRVCPSFVGPRFRNSAYLAFAVQCGGIGAHHQNRPALLPERNYSSDRRSTSLPDQPTLVHGRDTTEG